jgi:hypothetical protein
MILPSCAFDGMTVPIAIAPTTARAQAYFVDFIMVNLLSANVAVRTDEHSPVKLFYPRRPKINPEIKH